MIFIAGESRDVEEKGVNDAEFGKHQFQLMIVK